MIVIYSLLVTLIAAIFEMLLGNWHFYLPLLANIIFYFSVATSWRLAMLLAVVGGMALDMVWFRGGFYSAAMLVMVVIVSRWWMSAGLDSPVAMNAVSGFAMPWFAVPVMIFFQYATGAEEKIGFSWLRMSELTLAGMINSGVLLLIILLLDMISVRAGFDTFSSSFVRRKKEAEEI